MTNKTDFGEPWEIGQIVTGPNAGLGVYLDGKGPHTYLSKGKRLVAIVPLLEVGSRQDAERIRDCVNACAGLTDEELKRVQAVNEMYEALILAKAITADRASGGRMLTSREAAEIAWDKIQSALAKADEGREP